MNVVVNGERHELPDGATVRDLTVLRGARERGSAVAVDGIVVPRGEWARQVLRDGQVVEVVHAVQGG